MVSQHKIRIACTGNGCMGQLLHCLFILLEPCVGVTRD